MEPRQENKVFDQAVRFVQQSDQHIFLTGKAGTGKTTFLRHISEITSKKIAVVAPTGVAAINAGGVTIHSFFQLAPGIFLPSFQHGWGEPNTKIITPDLLVKNSRFSSQKKELLRELDTLVIDEVSMLKADTLDAMDYTLRWVRQDMKTPFGGVQLVYIGDLFQLPPVVKDEEWTLLKNHYSSPFFFAAKVIREAKPLYLELKTIYRQNNPEFIHLLNAVRNNIAGPDEYALLHTRYLPDYRPHETDTYITLTTHNVRADIINREALRNLDFSPLIFKAKITGDFPEKLYPVDAEMQLKEGAQIMFIKNDRGEARRYYNGKIGVISKIKDDKIHVAFPGTEIEFELEKETWRNIRYQLDKEKNALIEEELGRFEQYPIRLAWAITIHKSQGLTFEKAIIDAGESFSAGQVYVALSRMTSLEGMVLKSRIPASAIKTDDRVINYCRETGISSGLDEILRTEQERYIRKMMVRVFGMEKIHALIVSLSNELKELLIPEESELIAIGALENKITDQKNIAISFQRQLEHLILNAEIDGYAELGKRVEAAAEWFNKFYLELDREINEKLPSSKSSKSRVSFSAKQLRNLLLSVRLKLHQLVQVRKIAEGLASKAGHDELLQLTERCSIPENISLPKADPLDSISTKSKSKIKSGISSPEVSLEMFKAGKPIPEIATERALTIETISKHLIEFLPTGEVFLNQLVPDEKINVIRHALINSEVPGLKVIKEKLGEDYSYQEIRAVAAIIKTERSVSIH